MRSISCCVRALCSRARQPCKLPQLHPEMHPVLSAALVEKMKISAPNEVQTQALLPAMRGRDVLVCAQTGSGKTLISLLPLLHRVLSAPPARATPGLALQPTTLMLAPTRELALQHESVARQLAGSSIATISGSMGGDHDREGDVSLVVTTPARLLEQLSLGSVCLGRLEAVAIDEVDAVLCGGSAHDQRMPDIAMELLHALRGAGQPQMLLTTAHLSDAHQALLIQEFPDAELVRQRANSAHTGILVPSLRQRFHYFSDDKDAKLVRVLQAATEDPWLCAGSALVFCSESLTAERVHSLLAAASPELNPVLLHDQLLDEARASSAAAFRDNTSRLLVCTGVAVRGLNFPSLRHVVMYDVLEGVADFVHCAGRTARRGQKGLLTCLVPAGAGSRHGTRYQHLHSLQPAAPLTFDQTSHDNVDGVRKN
uniref:ATP-dependent RNA helicase n=1 Tax=Coccolithus braarudii TaxID=221442 RepID=A0A7S0Q302_9EUKA|mmetsp:Transcript_31789/g.68330  ORF Transcript_31789/g.68330 Transcript_31789/m.68330 type:complete len:427 (+) Transcript_31789:94-1374(+)